MLSQSRPVVPLWVPLFTLRCHMVGSERSTLTNRTQWTLERSVLSHHTSVHMQASTDLLVSAGGDFKTIHLWFPPDQSVTIQHGSKLWAESFQQAAAVLEGNTSKCHYWCWKSAAVLTLIFSQEHLYTWGCQSKDQGEMQMLSLFYRVRKPTCDESQLLTCLMYYNTNTNTANNNFIIIIIIIIVLLLLLLLLLQYYSCDYYCCCKNLQSDA